MEIIFSVNDKDEITDEMRDIFSKLLIEQNKVLPPYDNKIDRCRYFCIVRVNDTPIALGAIKQKTNSDFDENKANLQDLRDHFPWELGYLYTKTDYCNLGIGTMVVKLLLNKYGSENLMASTEITNNPAMVKLLVKNGFKQYGEPWKSSIHDHYLGLFLKFK